MTPGPVTRRIAFALAGLLILALSGSGFIAGVAQLPESQTIGQKAQTYCQFGYALRVARRSASPSP